MRDDAGSVVLVKNRRIERHNCEFGCEPVLAALQDNIPVPELSVQRVLHWTHLELNDIAVFVNNPIQTIKPGKLIRIRISQLLQLSLRAHLADQPLALSGQVMTAGFPRHHASGATARRTCLA